MEWEILATWFGLAIVVGGMVYAMGKQAQKIENQGDRIDDLEEQLKQTQQTPIKLAALETDIKYLVQEISTLKNFLMRRGIE